MQEKLDTFKPQKKIKRSISSFRISGILGIVSLSLLFIFLSLSFLNDAIAKFEIANQKSLSSINEQIVRDRLSDLKNFNEFIIEITAANSKDALFRDDENSALKTVKDVVKEYKYIDGVAVFKNGEPLFYAYKQGLSLYASFGAVDTKFENSKNINKDVGNFEYKFYFKDREFISKDSGYKINYAQIEQFKFLALALITIFVISVLAIFYFGASFIKSKVKNIDMKFANIEDDLTNIAENSAIAIFKVSIKTDIILYANEKFADFINLGKDEIIGKKIQNFAIDWKKISELAEAGVVIEHENLNFLKSGYSRAFSGYIYADVNKKGWYLICYLIDSRSVRLKDGQDKKERKIKKDRLLDIDLTFDKV